MKNETNIDNYILELKQIISERGLIYDITIPLMQAGEHCLSIGKRTEGLELLGYAKKCIENYVEKTMNGSIFDLERFCFDRKVTSEQIERYYHILLVEAQNRVLDSYFLYLEKNREFKDRFYLPKRKCFMKIGLIDDLQAMLDDKLDILSISMPPGTGKTTLSKFFVSGVIGWYPKDFNLFFSHSADIARMYYDGALDIVTNASEYTWAEVFPGLGVTSQNAKSQTFNVGKYRPFQSLQCTSRSSNNAGIVRCSKFLLVDDLVAGISEALNKNILDKLWDIYTVDARQRMIEGCKQIIIATRWSVHDPIGRLKNLYANDDRAKFVAVSCYDEETGESNFEYDYDGFSKKFYDDQQMAMDDISFKCLYMNQPVEREGLLYHEDDLRRFLSLPVEDPDAIVAICDTKTSGIDYMYLPVFYQYGDDYYLVDCICDNSTDFDLQINKLASIIERHGVQKCEFESNAGGNRLAYDVEKKLKERGCTVCSITTKPTETNKETRIIVNSDWVKKNVLFKSSDLYTKRDEYGVMMSFVLSYSVSGKNVHDDVVDGLANFALFIENMYRRHSKAIIMRSPL